MVQTNLKITTLVDEDETSGKPVHVLWSVTQGYSLSFKTCNETLSVSTISEPKWMHSRSAITTILTSTSTPSPIQRKEIKCMLTFTHLGQKRSDRLPRRRPHIRNNIRVCANLPSWQNTHDECPSPITRDYIFAARRRRVERSACFETLCLWAR